MQPKSLALTFLIALFCIHVPLSPTHAQMDKIIKGLEVLTTPNGNTGEAGIVKGLKEALEVGTKNVVAEVSKAGGYYDNPAIRIPLPAPLEKVTGILKVAGYGPQLEAFDQSMNRAAEKASSQAKEIFWKAIKQMTFTDARSILEGSNNEATLYFEQKTGDRLRTTFRPIIAEAMNDVGVTRSYQQLDDKLRTIPFTQPLRFDLADYVNEKALQGLFTMLAEEENKIRTDPAARVTDTLKEVFSRRSR